MKIENLSGFILALSVAWIACAFAYTSGIFWGLNSHFLGLLGVQDVLSAGASRAAMLIVLDAPIWLAIAGSTSWLVAKSRILQFRAAIVVIAALVVAALGVAFSGLSQHAHVDFELVQKALYAALVGIFIIAVSYDLKAGGYWARAAAFAGASLITSFSMGLEVGRTPNERPVRVVLKDGRSVCGSLLYASKAGLFLADAQERTVQFLKDDQYGQLEQKSCADGGHKK